jgi:hypothetical protein
VPVAVATATPAAAGPAVTIEDTPIRAVDVLAVIVSRQLRKGLSEIQVYNGSLYRLLSPPSHLEKLTHYNTMGGGGGERIAARKVIISKCLKVEAEHTSRGEDPPPVTPSQSYMTLVC